MEISLEHIDLIRQRTGVSYKEAQQALEVTGGSVVDALVFLEGEETAETEPTAKRNFFPSAEDYPNVEDNRHADAEHPPGKHAGKQNERKQSRSNGNVQNKIVSSVVNFSKNSRIKVSLPGNRTVEIPTVLSAAGAILMPKAMAVSGLALLMTKSTLSMENKTGEQGDLLPEDNS